MDSRQQVMRKTLICPNCSTDSDYKNHLTQVVFIYGYNSFYILKHSY